MDMSCFKSYDVRGVIGETVSEEAFYAIAKATVRTLQANSVVIGHDARESSPSLSRAFKESVLDEGAQIIDLGLAGTEEVYFATSHYGTDAGVAITASHNPINYNGIKFVGKGSRPLKVEEEFMAIKDLAQKLSFKTVQGRQGAYTDKSVQSKVAYAHKVLSFVDPTALQALKVVVNCGNGAAGPALRQIIQNLHERGSSLKIVTIFEEPDSSFPNGIPNPMLSENHFQTAEKVISEKADLGVAFDGDFDRCFFFDSNGDFVPGEIMVGLLAEFFTIRNERENIVHDPRLIFNTQKVCETTGAKAIQSRTGHLFVKGVMREHNAIYGGEISAHHYFRDFYYCDSGMIPLLLVCDLVGSLGVSLTDLISKRKELFPSSGEINFPVSDPAKVLKEIEKIYVNTALDIEKLDGLSCRFHRWRFNLRGSNTEPLLRLNVETIEDGHLLDRCVEEISAHVKMLSV